MKRKKPALAFAVAVLSGLVALMGAVAMRDRVRLVDILQLFAGGAGAGAGITATVAGLRRARANIYPALKYQNGPAALEWLLNAFGFTKRVEAPGPDGTLAHAELSLGRGAVMLGSIGKPDGANPWPTASYAVYVYVQDVDAHYARARAAGARIVRELHDTSYGAREYSALDLEGKLWSFGTYYPET